MWVPKLNSDAIASEFCGNISVHETVMYEIIPNYTPVSLSQYYVFNRIYKQYFLIITSFVNVLNIVY